MSDTQQPASQTAPKFPAKSDLIQVGRGLLMGGADIIPGVSGGTVALILGIYQRLVTAISHCDARLFHLLAKRQWSDVAVHLDLRFVLPLGVGILTGVVSLASLMHYLLDYHLQLTLSVFFGLILASSYLVAQMVKRWTVLNLLAFLPSMAAGEISRCYRPVKNDPEGAAQGKHRLERTADGDCVCTGLPDRTDSVQQGITLAAAQLPYADDGRLMWPDGGLAQTNLAVQGGCDSLHRRPDTRNGSVQTSDLRKRLACRVRRAVLEFDCAHHPRRHFNLGAGLSLTKICHARHIGTLIELRLFFAIILRVE